MDNAILSLNIESYILPCIEIMQCNHFNCALDSRVDSRTWILVRNMSTKTSVVLIANAATCLNPYYDDLSLLARKDLARVTYTSWHSKQATHLR